MRVFILTLGTRGDFELFCTLGRELSGRGHHVVIGTSAFYAQCVRAAGLECLPVGQGTHVELVGVLRSFASVDDKVRRARVFAARWLRPQLAAAAELISAAGSASDYFISNLKLTLQRGDDVLPGAFVSYDPPDSVENLAHYGSGRHGGRVLELVAMNRALVDPGRGWPGEFRFTGFSDAAEVGREPIGEAGELPWRGIAAGSDDPRSRCSPAQNSFDVVDGPRSSGRSAVVSIRRAFHRMMLSRVQTSASRWRSTGSADRPLARAVSRMSRNSRRNPCCWPRVDAVRRRRPAIPWPRPTRRSPRPRPSRRPSGCRAYERRL